MVAVPRGFVVSELPIPAEAVEVAARANVEGGPNERRGDWDGMSERDKQKWREGAEAALRAGLEAMGVRVEASDWFGQDEYRLVSRRLPVEQEGER